MVLLTSNHGKYRLNQAIFAFNPSPAPYVSIHQMISPEPGFAMQLKGQITTSRYKVVIVFVDYFSCLSYIHLQKNAMSFKTLKVKKPLKHTVTCYDIWYVIIIASMVDLHIMPSYLMFPQIKIQSVSFCCNNTNFQNGIAEKAIYNLKEQVQEQILHACARLPIHSSLWPYMLMTACHASNILLVDL